MEIVNYINLVDAIREISHKYHVEKFYDGDIYENQNTTSTVKYPCMNITLQNTETDYENMTRTFNVYLFHFQRLTDDKDNMNFNITNADEVLNDICKDLEREHDATILSTVFTPFRERFQDLCSGGFISLRVRFDLSECEFYD